MKSNSLLILSGALVFAACGGGSEQVAGIDARGTPTPVASVVSKGTLTSFGSVIVNGVTFDTSSATFTIDGSAGSQSDLAVGQVIVVQGELGDDPTTGTADSVTFDDAVEGPISGIDTAMSTFTVLGQTVRVDADTSFDDSISPASLEGLNVDDIVEVSGFFLTDGSIAATRIELKLAGSEFELTGIVSNVVGTTFEINGFVVDFSNANEVIGFPTGTPEDGQLVEAKGATPGGSAGPLVATRVEFKGGDFGAEGDRGELEGFITRFDVTTPTDFDVEGVPVMTNAQTVFEPPGSDPALNRKVEVEGDINAAGVLVATRVEIKASGFLRFEALVEDVQADRLTLLGIVIRVNESTRYEDKSDENREPFNLSHVDGGNFVEVRGFEDAGGVVATRLEREDLVDFTGEVALRGFVDAGSASDPDFTILGVAVTTFGATVFRDLDGTEIDRADFFPDAEGSLVEASGTWNGSTITASEVQFEN